MVDYSTSPSKIADKDNNPQFRCFVKVVLIGECGVGKTSLIKQFEKGSFTDTYKLTIGADFSNKEVHINDQVVTL